MRIIEERIMVPWCCMTRIMVLLGRVGSCLLLEIVLLSGGQARPGQVLLVGLLLVGGVAIPRLSSITPSPPVWGLLALHYIRVVVRVRGRLVAAVHALLRLVGALLDA